MVNLICSPKTKKTVTTLLNSHGIEIHANANLILVERNQSIPKEGIVILFNQENIKDVIRILKEPEFLLTPKQMDILTVKNGDRFQVLKVDQVFYFTSCGNYVYCVTKDAKYEIKKKLYDLEIILAHKGFIRINKSQVINIQKVKEIIPWFAGRLILKFCDINQELQVSRRYMPCFREFLEF